MKKIVPCPFFPFSLAPCSFHLAPILLVLRRRRCHAVTEVDKELEPFTFFPFSLQPSAFNLYPCPSAYFPKSHFQIGITFICFSMMVSSSHVTIVPVGSESSFIALFNPWSSLSKVFSSDISQHT